MHLAPLALSKEINILFWFWWRLKAFRFLLPICISWWPISGALSCTRDDVFVLISLSFLLNASKIWSIEEEVNMYCMYFHLRVRPHVRLCVCVGVSPHVRLRGHPCVCMYVCLAVCMYVCMYVVVLMCLLIY